MCQIFHVIPVRDSIFQIGYSDGPQLILLVSILFFV